MRQSRKYYILFLFIFLSVGCSTKKNTGVTRFYHALTTKYNILFNGSESYKEGLKNYEDAYVEDYSQILPIFIYGDKELASASKGSMDRTIEKSTKSIRLHSITKKPDKDKRTLTKKDKAFYDKNEYNIFIDDSYLIMAKAFFYQADYESAIRLFSFIAKQYDDEETKYLAYNWLVRSYVQIKDFREAGKQLEFLEEEIEYPEKLRYELNLTYADFYLKQQKYSESILYVEEALNLAKRKKAKLRLTFILAQLKEESGDLRNASDLYAKVIKMNPPYEMAFNAKLKRASLYSGGGKSLATIKAELIEMLDDDKNIEFQDQIYFALGEIERRNGNLTKAIEYYQLSASHTGLNQNQKGITYLTLANIFFDQALYVESQAYFDSAVVSLDPDYPGYTELSIKNQYLSNLVKNLSEVKHQDSLQMVAKMPEKERDLFIDKIISDLKVKEAEDERIEKEQLMAGYDNNRLPVRRGNNLAEGGNWYFYNPSAKSFGEPEFKRRWGNRKLEDNWRRRNKRMVGFEQVTEEEFSDDILDAKAGLDNKTPEYYKVELPLTDSAMAASHLTIQRSLYNVGEVYRNDLKDYPLALEAYKELIDRYPDGEYKVPSYYAIYKVYADQNDMDKADIYKSMIIRNYPDTKYAKVLLDPNYFKQFEEEEIEQREYYERTLTLYKNENFSEVIRRSDFAIAKYKNPEYIPKYRYLKAISIGESFGVSAMKPELERIIDEFKNDPVVFASEKLLVSIKENELKNLNKLAITDSPVDTIKEKTEEELQIAEKTIEEIEKVYKYNSKEKHTFAIVISNKADINQLKFNIINFNLDYDIQQTFDVESKDFNEYTIIITVREFENQEKAKDFLYKFYSQKNQLFTDVKTEDYQMFIISNSNLNSLIGQKMISDYLLFYKKYYKE